MDDMAEEQHERTCHRDAQTHHRHTHAAGSRHEGGHHLLQVEGLEVGFRMYDEDAPFFRAKRRVVPVIEDMSISVHAGVFVAVLMSPPPRSSWNISRLRRRCDRRKVCG